MLIYNYQKEFLGIDENDLKVLGFSDLSQLRNEAADFADFFVKTPGFVHNFKHVHWIDFVTCAEGNEDSKVIIHANGKNFRCTLDIRTSYLIDNPKEKAYLVHLMNLRALTHAENEQIAGDIIERPVQQATTAIQNKTFFETPEFISDEPEIKESIVEKEEQTVKPAVRNNFEKLDVFQEENEFVQKVKKDDFSIDLDENFVQEKKIEVPQVKKAEQSTPKPVPSAQFQKPKITLNVGDDYVYDPHVASEELGLPIDLIEEFIQDFINQANDFKADLYSSLRDNNISNVKILSHKLKGVAANLRVEDAFEVLTTINTVDDTEIIEMNLDALYVIIDNLAQKNGAPVKNQDNSTITEEQDDDDFVLDFKDEDEKITIPEENFSTENEHKIELNLDEVQAQESVNGTPIEIEIDDTQKENFQTESSPEEKILTKNIEEEPKLNLEIEDEPIKLELNLDTDKNDENETDSSIQLLEEKDLLESIEEVIDENITQVQETPEISTKTNTEEKDTDNVYVKSDESMPQVENSKLVYNKQLVANEIGIDIQSFNELFNDYVSEANAACEKIKKFIEENDSDSWQRYAIKLKGMSDNMRVHDITAELKSIIHTTDAQKAKRAISVISTKLEQISKVEV